MSDDDILVNNKLVVHDEVYLDYGDADIDGEVNCEMASPDAANISDTVLNSEDPVSFDGCAVDLVDEAAVSKAKEMEMILRMCSKWVMIAKFISVNMTIVMKMD